MAIEDPRADLQGYSEEPCDLCGAKTGVLEVEMNCVTCTPRGVYEGDLCWDCLRRSYDNPALLAATESFWHGE